MLEIRNLSVRYGRHQALDGVSAKVGKGEICVILGANGAGKSSLLKAIAGTVRAEPGSEILMNGVPIARHEGAPDRRAGHRAGSGRPRHFRRTDGCRKFAARRVSEPRARQGSRNARQIFALFPRLAERKSQIARTMSGGEQQMVAIGRALMSQPEILMLDEPSLGLSPVLTKELFRSLAKIAETGVGILLVEQNARQSLKIAQRGYLIEVGRITGEGTAQSLMTRSGRDQCLSRRRCATRVGKPVRLPAPFPLPGDLASIGRLIGSLASRAGAIQVAFVRALRQAAVAAERLRRALRPDESAAIRGTSLLPLAACGPVRAHARRRSDGKRLAERLGDLAQAAARRHARHIRRIARIAR